MFKPKLSIEDQGGISIYLDSTASQHNGFGSDKIKLFKQLVDAKKIPKTAAAALCNVSLNTWKKWAHMFDEEGNE